MHKPYMIHYFVKATENLAIAAHKGNKEKHEK